MDEALEIERLLEKIKRIERLNKSRSFFDEYEKNKWSELSETIKSRGDRLEFPDLVEMIDMLSFFGQEELLACVNDAPVKMRSQDFRNIYVDAIADVFKKLNIENSSVIELGGGCGSLMARIKNAFDFNFSATVVDFSPSAVDVGQTYFGDKINFVLDDLEKAEKSKTLMLEADLIFSSFALACINDLTSFQDIVTSGRWKSIVLFEPVISNIDVNAKYSELREQYFEACGYNAGIFDVVKEIQQKTRCDISRQEFNFIGSNFWCPCSLFVLRK